MKRFFLIALFMSFVFVNVVHAQKYFIIVSSHSIKESAKVQVDKLKSSGFTNAGLLYSTEVKRYRVFLNSYQSKKDCLSDSEKYKSKYVDLWILQSKFGQEEPVPQKSKEIELLKTQIDTLKTELVCTRDSIQNILEQISRLKHASNASNEDMENLILTNDENKLKIIQLEEHIEKLVDYIDKIEKEKEETEEEIQNLTKELKNIKVEYLKENDTVAYSWNVIPKKFMQPIVSLSFGVNNTSVLTNVDDYMYPYFLISEENFSQNFFGIYAGLDFHFLKKWSLGLDFNAYFYNQHKYFFPALVLKYHQRFGDLPFLLTPSFALGTEVFLPQNGNALAGRFLQYRPGIEFEWNLSNSLSFFGNCNYYINSYFGNDNYSVSDLKYIGYNFGIRLNINQSR